MKRKGFGCSFQLILKGSGFSFGRLSDAGPAAGRELSGRGGSGGESRAPASGGNLSATPVIRFKPSISREMKSGLAEPLLTVKTQNLCVYMRSYMRVCVCLWHTCLGAVTRQSYLDEVSLKLIAFGLMKGSGEVLPGRERDPSLEHLPPSSCCAHPVKENPSPVLCVCQHRQAARLLSLPERRCGQLVLPFLSWASLA